MDEKREAIKIVKELTRKEILFALARVPGSQRLIFGGSDFQVSEIDLAEAKPEARPWGRHESYVTGLAVAGGRAISGGYDGKLIWWDVQTGSPIRTIEAHSKWIRDVAASPDGTTVASVADDMVCRVWDVETGTKRLELLGHEPITPHHFPSMLYACAFTPDGRYLATADKVGHIVVWDVAMAEPVSLLEAPIMYTWDPVQRRHSIGGIRTLAFSPDGSQLAVGGIGKISNIDHLDGNARVEVFDWRQGKRTHEFPCESTKGLVEQLAFLPGGDRLIAVGGTNDGFVVVLDLKSKAAPIHQKYPTHLHDVVLGELPETAFAVGHGKIAVLALS
jgi:WD40 repeat protein